MVEIYDFGNSDIFSFLKKSSDSTEKVFVVANINTKAGVDVKVPNMFEIMEGNSVKDISHGHRMDEVSDSLEYYLQPGETKLFYQKLK